MNPEKKLEELFIDLPEPPQETGSSVNAIRAGKFLHVGGMLPYSEGRLQYPGRAGVEVRADNAKFAARIAAVNTLAAAKKELGNSIKDIKQVVRTDGFVACGVDFRDHAKVIDGASELFAQVFGPAGKGARTAVGVSSLPNNACVEIAVVFELK